MIPAGIRLDLFHGAAQLPNEVCIPLIETKNMVDSMGYSAHVKAGPTEALDTPGHESREYRLAKRTVRLEQHVLLTNVSERIAYIPAFDRLAMLVSVGDLPRREGYVRSDYKKALREGERDEGRVDSGVTDEDSFEIRFPGNASDGDSKGDHDDSDINEESAERLQEPRGETKVMNTATWVQLISDVGDDASSTMTKETTIVSDGKRPSGDSSASYIATSENEGTTTGPEEIHASLKVLDTFASVRLGPGVKATPAEEAVVTLDEGYISVTHVLTTEENEISDDTGRHYLTEKFRSAKYRHIVKEYNAAADSLATEALESKICRVVLAEARKSELATLNRIQEVIYEPHEDEGTTKFRSVHQTTTLPSRDHCRAIVIPIRDTLVHGTPCMRSALSFMTIIKKWSCEEEGAELLTRYMVTASNREALEKVKDIIEDVEFWQNLEHAVKLIDRIVED
ncbi:hypothetical protein F443_20057 [Phytophthora nicotianae P1569]|uniref:Uncharacterized protein n=5 Tax=Phytophthora nicotianae TaxID=4792 RepID=V9E4M6_PHYNI|nr:hypothetical protein F443_20057 [Phytophthora nicotianae P1569]